MPFVKLDCGILDSSIWIDKDAREIFITALLMAEPHELTEPTPEIATREIEPTGFIVDPGWYGIIRAASVGIIRRAGIENTEAGMAALERLAAPDGNSRSKKYDGRRLVRIDGGYIALNYDDYRLRDYTGAERAKRYRRRVSELRQTVTRDGVTRHRDVTQEEGEVYAKDEKKLLSAPAHASADSEFEQLWNANLKKRSKGQARKSYMKLRKAGTLPPHAELLAKFIARQAAQDWTKDGRQFQPHLSSWLNAEGWNDEIDPNSVQDRRAFGSTPDRAAAYGAIGKRVTAKDLAK